MDLQYAERLAAAADPKAIMALQNQNRDPAVGKAVAEQFGTLLMQRVMQNADGSALKMADGVGSGVVNSMFADTMAQTAMSGDQLGLADMLFRSMNAKQQQQPSSAGGNGATAAAGTTNSGAPAAAAGAAAPAAPISPAASHGFSLSGYWVDHGLRPLGGGLVHNASPPAGGGRGAAGAGFALPGHNAGVTGRAPAAEGGVAAPPVASPPTQPASAPSTSAAPTGNGGGSTSVGTADGDAATAAFTQQLAPLLEKAGQQLGVSPKVLLAQAALETGWGRSVVGNNVFGIKAGSGWQGAQISARTHEVEEGRTVAETASFRAYDSLADAVQDFVSLVAGGGRYRAALDTGDSAKSYGQALIAGGYASDGSYPAKLAAVAASPGVADAFTGPISLLPAGFAGGGSDAGRMRSA